jgi:hypothetical protein
MSGGAAADPRLYDEFSSSGTPSNVGAPQGPFPFSKLAIGTPQGKYLTPFGGSGDKSQVWVLGFGA